MYRNKSTGELYFKIKDCVASYCNSINGNCNDCAIFKGFAHWPDYSYNCIGNVKTFNLLSKIGFEKIKEESLEESSSVFGLDEAIVHAKEIVEKCDVCEGYKKQHLQLVAWLEELKELREFKKKLTEIVRGDEEIKR